MYLKLKNVSRTFEVTAPTERTLKGAENGVERNFWVLSFSINEKLTTEEIEDYFTPETTERMIFVTPLPNGTESEYVTNNYVKKVFNTIKLSLNGECTVDFQFSKHAS
jgi:hypothetical protein